MWFLLISSHAWYAAIIIILTFALPFWVRMPPPPSPRHIYVLCALFTFYIQHSYIRYQNTQNIYVLVPWFIYVADNWFCVFVLNLFCALHFHSAATCAHIKTCELINSFFNIKRLCVHMQHFEFRYSCECVCLCVFF